jgi:hypothetical protein
MIQYAKNYFVKITICLKFLYLYHILANLGCHRVSISLGCHIKFHIFFGQNLKVLAIVSGAKTVKKDTFNQVTSHCSFTRLKPERIGSFSFALRLSRNPKDFSNFCEGFWRVGTNRADIPDHSENCQKDIS